MKIAIALIAAASLAVGACGPQTGPPSSAGEVVAGSIDSLETADKVFDALLDGVNLLVAKKVIETGSPLALKLAAAIRATDAALNAGNSWEVKQGIALVRTLLAGVK